MSDEAEDVAALVAIFEACAARREAISQGIAVEPGSSLAGDDRATRPWQLSSALWNLMQSALDNMHALDNTVQGAQTFHLFAPYTLLRAALENSCVVIWLLSPPARRERVRRRLVTMNKEIQDLDKIRRLTDQPPMHALRVPQLVELGRLQGLSPGHVIGKAPSLERIVTEAGQTAHMDRIVPLCWAAWSGLAHGRETSTAAILTPQMLGEITPGQWMARIEASPKSITLSATVTDLMIGRALHLVQQRSQAPFWT